MEAGDYPEAEQQCRGALTVDPAHSAVNKELQLALCRALKSQSRASEAVQASRPVCIHMMDEAARPALWPSDQTHGALDCSP
jgi:Tetratricopeptide repeat